MVSVAHLFDLVDADDATIARWSTVVGWLGPADRIVVDGDAAQFEPYSPDDVAPGLALGAWLRNTRRCACAPGLGCGSGEVPVAGS